MRQLLTPQLGSNFNLCSYCRLKQILQPDTQKLTDGILDMKW